MKFSTTIINIKTDPRVKTKAQKTATDLGLTLSSVINGYLKQFVRTKTVHFSLNEENPSPYLLSSLEEAKKDRLEKQHYSFKNNKEALDFLDKK
ncbi:MAG: type II toxin-antitoxin system RelB/DinJ family antitoxin [Patescibacteria group bacterium]